MSALQSCTIEELAADEKSALATGPFGSAVSSKHFRSEGVPMLRGSNLSEHVGIRLEESELVYLEPELAAKFARSTVGRGDIIFTCWGSVGQIGFIGPDSAFERYIVSNKQMKLTPDPTKVDPLFLYYNLSQPKMINEVKSRAIGSTIPGFNLGQLRSIPVDLPDQSEQRAIAEVLGALDDKIAVNTKLANRAETLAKHLFDETITAVGAEHMVLQDVAENVPGKYLSKDNYVSDGPYYVYGSNSVMGRHNESLCQGGFIVLAKIGSYCGNLRWSQRPAWVNNNASAIVPKPGVDALILRHALDKIDMNPHRAGTGQPYIRMQSLFSTTITVPPTQVHTKLGDSLRNLAEQETLAEEESHKLAATRDALLPHLMSRKLRVKDAEQLVEASV